ncbi:hypothetical protein BD847_2074 [Flavobacterium cutihirudinis]|uniref:Uncharacterized protein n=1 Tax=Flavobacterium cutihirudinis TaxID=1265740 RepID=A0A3D9FX41_9FLAO|nr:hypothetical protein [Flavobacterium cutihirudinis]RED25324.1 hypothetical protein BD847_2074 [Flavobacterium cutihirudinis]
MRIVLNPASPMKLLALLKQIKNNPWIGVIVSLVFIIPSLYKILDDITVFRKEYIILAVSFPLYLRSLKKIFDETLDSFDDFKD